jgi:hypothetical protein
MRSIVLATLTSALAACSTSTAGHDDGGDAGGTGLQVGAVCGDNSSCTSNVCLGRCCTAPCITSPGHPECSACDETGACTYPTGQCIEPSCDPVTRTATAASFCSGGSCPAGATTVCSASCQGSVCGSGCLGDQDCANGYRCVFSPDAGALTATNGGSCVAQQGSGGPCMTANDCSSGLCLGGACCNQSCTVDPVHPECTPACDSTGACIYSTQTCIPAHCDPVNNALVQASYCNQGLCPAEVSQSCGNYQCSLQGCSNTCVADRDCASSGFCVQDNGKGECCPILISGGKLYVDLATGSDVSCCGVNPTTPCQTIARAFAVAQLSAAKVQEIGLSAFHGYEVDLSIDGGGGDWQSPPRGAQTDSFPLYIPDGVVLHAPGIELGPLDFGGGGSTDAGYAATVEGDSANPVLIGINRNNQVNGNFSQMNLGGTLNLSNVVIFSGLLVIGSTDPTITTALNLGLDSQGNDGGFVQFGWDETSGPLNGSTLIPPSLGLAVVGPNYGFPAGPMLVNDYGPPGDQVLRVYNRTRTAPGWIFGVQLGTGVVANLTHDPIIKGGRADGGYGGLVGLANAGELHLKGATITNQAVTGLLAASGTTTLEGCTINENGCFGVLVGSLRSETNGTSGQSQFYNDTFYHSFTGPGAVLFASGTTISKNFIGLVQDGSDQSGGHGQGQLTDLRYAIDGSPGGNQITCNDRSHAYDDPNNIACQAYESGGPGGNVWNRSSHYLYADNVTWAPQTPGVWTCDNLLTPTSCYTDGGTYCQSGGGCLTTPLPAVDTVDTAGAGQLTVGSATLATTSCP